MSFVLCLLVVCATLCAAVVAYGTDAAWANHSHGFAFILWSRRLQWLLVAFCLLLCVAMVAIILANRRRLWFLVALAPVLALFAHRFAPTHTQMSIEEAPNFVDVAAALDTVHDEDYVVGFPLGDQWYAYPYAALFRHPVVFSADRDQRVILIWSAFANRAVAASITHDLRGRDLEIVSTPQNALLVYNTRVGEFVNGVTALTTGEKKPAGFSSMLSTSKVPWGVWRQAHTATKVMVLRNGELPPGPSQPIAPTSPSTALISDAPPAEMHIAMIGAVHPLAIAEGSLPNAPLNVTVDEVPIFIVRDGSRLRAFDRRLPSDLTPRFTLNSGKKHPGATFVDADTDSGWSVDGKWLDGFKDLKGKKLQPIPVEQDLYWGVMKYWYPQLKLNEPGGYVG